MAKSHTSSSSCIIRTNLTSGTAPTEAPRAAFAVAIAIANNSDRTRGYLSNTVLAMDSKAKANGSDIT